MTLRLTPVVICATLLGLSGCGFISFRKPLTDDEVRLEQDVRSYYGSIRTAFAAGNAQMLAGLFDPSITHPMSHAEIEAWGEKFFAEHGRAHFKISKIDFRELAFERAVVDITYAVEPVSGHGGFKGTEEDTLVKHAGRWYTASWDKLP